MNCPQCQQENPPHAKFCLECGAPVDGPVPISKPYADLKAENEELRRSLDEALEQQTATAEILRAMSASPTDLQGVLDTLAASAARLCDSVDAQIFRIDGTVLRIAAFYGDLPKTTAADARPIDRATVNGRAVVDRQTIHVHDLAAASDTEFPLAKAYQKRFGHRTIVATPLLREGTPIGAITIRRMEVRPFSEKEIKLLETFADQAVIAIENVRLFNETKEALEQQTATAEVLGVISSSPTAVQPVFDSIVASATRLCEGLFSAVYRYDGELIHLVAHHKFSPAALAAARQAFPMAPSRGGAVSRAVLTREVVHIPDLRLDPEYAHQALARDLGFPSILAVPMLRDGVPIGAIAVAGGEAAPFSDKQITLLKVFADQAVIAIENARLFKELQTRNADLIEALDRQTATSEILRVISQSPTEVQPVFEAIVRSAAALCHAPDVIILVADGDSLRFGASVGPVAASVGHSQLIRDRSLPLTRGSVSGRAVIDRRTVHIHDVSTTPGDEFPEGKRLQRQYGGRGTTLAVPLLRDDVSLGVITLLRNEVRPFTDQQVALLETFADQAVIAIDNVRLFTELQKKNRALTEAHARVTETLEQQTATSEILRAIAHAPTDTQPVFDAIVRSGVRLCNAFTATVLLTDGTMMYLPANYGSSSEVLAKARALWPRPLDTTTAAGTAILTRSVIQIPDSEDPSASEFVRQSGRLLGYRSSLAVPMLRGTEAIGAIRVTRREPSRFADAEVELLKTFADQAVIAIENVRLFKELQARNGDLTEALERQTATSEILRVISSSPTDVQPVFDAIVASGRRLCDAEQCALVGYDGETLTLLATANFTAEGQEALRGAFPYRANRSGTAGRAVLDRAMVHIPDVMQDSEYAFKDVAKAAEYRAHLGIPMFRDADVIGVLIASRGDPGPFSQPQIDLLKTFASQAVIAIENVRLFNELQARTAELTRSVDELTALGEVSQAISSTLDLQTVLQTIVARATELAGVDAGVIYEYNQHGEIFVPRATERLEAEIVATLIAAPVRKGEGVTGRLADAHEPIQLSDILEAPPESRVRDTLGRAGYRALLAVPLVREDHLLGGLTVFRRTPGKFSLEVIELLRTFATQSTLAIQNARLFQEIADKSRQLEAASQHKSEFLANMSHELRTPLNAIIGFSEVLGERLFGDLNAKQEEYLKDIHASGQHLLSLINDILDLSKIEAGRMELELTDFDLPTAIDNALTLVRERAGRRGIALHQAAEEGLGQIRGDARKIKQVLLNLLSNAIKFTPDGGRIDVRARVVDGTVEVSVIDTGVGIAPEDQEAIFEEFRQVGTADKKVEGTGLGLALSRRFIELHGGRIWVKSEVGAGATFTFTLPRGLA